MNFRVEGNLNLLLSAGRVAVLLLPVVLLAQQAQRPPRPETDDGILSRLDESTKTLRQAVERVEEKVDDLSTLVSTMEGMQTVAAGVVAIGIPALLGLLTLFNARAKRLHEQERARRERERELLEKVSRNLNVLAEPGSEPPTQRLEEISRNLSTLVERGSEPATQRLEEISRSLITLVERGSEPATQRLEEISRTLNTLAERGLDLRRNVLRQSLGT